jgi:hypothetical protein
MEYSHHQKICIAQAVRIARLRGFAVDGNDQKYINMGLTWSAELRSIPEPELNRSIDEAWRWSDHSSPLTTIQIEDAWKGMQKTRAPESVQIIARMMNCAHDYHWYPEPGPLFEGFHECIRCGHARPVWTADGNTPGARYLAAGGVTI